MIDILVDKWSMVWVGRHRRSRIITGQSASQASLVPASQTHLADSFHLQVIFCLLIWFCTCRQLPSRCVHPIGLLGLAKWFLPPSNICWQHSAGQTCNSYVLHRWRTYRCMRLPRIPWPDCLSMMNRVFAMRFGFIIHRCLGVIPPKSSLLPRNSSDWQTTRLLSNSNSLLTMGLGQCDPAIQPCALIAFVYIITTFCHPVGRLTQDDWASGLFAQPSPWRPHLERKCFHCCTNPDLPSVPGIPVRTPFLGAKRLRKYT